MVSAVFHCISFFFIIRIITASYFWLYHNIYSIYNVCRTLTLLMYQFKYINKIENRFVYKDFILTFKKKKNQSERYI